MKKIKDLSTDEQYKICNVRRENNNTDKPYNACVDCPLRWGRQCMLCLPFISNALYARMHNAIGDRVVEV